MLQKIVLSQDRKHGRVFFKSHSIAFYHDQGKVWELIYEIVIEPGLIMERRAKEREERFLASLEKTVEINLSEIKKAA